MREQGSYAIVLRINKINKGEGRNAPLLYLSINLRCRQIINLQIALRNP